MHWTYDDISALDLVTETEPKRSMVMLGDKSFRDLVADFIRCVAEGQPSSTSGAEARETLRVGLAEGYGQIPRGSVVVAAPSSERPSSVVSRQSERLCHACNKRRTGYR